MSDSESERSGGTQPGLKKNDLLTRQTGDGSFEFIVEPASGDGYGYEAEASVGLKAEAPLAASPGRPRRMWLIGAGVVLLVVLIGASLLLSKSDDAVGSRDAQTADHEVSGFKPYGGGEPAAHVARPAAARVVKPTAAPVQERQEQHIQEAVDEMPLNVVVESEVQPEPDWQVGESEYVQEAEVLPEASAYPVVRDRINLQPINSRSIRSEKLRGIGEREGRRLANPDRIRGRRLEQIRTRQELVEESAEYESEEQVFEEEEFLEPEESGEEEFYDEEEVLEEENY